MMLRSNGAGAVRREATAGASDAPVALAHGETPVADPFGEHNVLQVDRVGGPRILAIDVGTSMGFALATQTYIASGTKSWTERKDETRGDRLYRFYRWLNAMRGERLDLVAYELVRGHGPGQILAAHCYAQFEGVLLTWCARYGIPVRTVHTGTLKKAITGRGNAKKPDMLAAVRGLGYSPDGHDEADALAVLHWATTAKAIE
ncbi:MAG: crossover junction endodeoxyribonuclease RuvC [Burkholderiales bacterium]|nr:crossover junction endodeoxyribonuclease RuvC [Burkholderiales bacterium]